MGLALKGVGGRDNSFTLGLVFGRISSYFDYRLTN